MTAMDIFWLFFIVTAMQPILKQKLIEASRQNMIHKLEKKHKSRVITLIHRQETMAFLGFPLVRFIDVNDSEEIIRAVHLTDKDVPIDLILHTPGGLVLAALQIARALKQHPARTRVFIPHYAMSGGTLISLAADEIVMCEHSVLGPVDPQINGMPAASVLKVLEQKPIAEIDDKTIILADQSKKAINQLRTSVTELLKDKMDEKQAQNLANILTKGTWTHDYAITYEQAKSFGLPVSNNMPEDILKLLSLYPQPTNRIPSVEYIPLPKKTDKGNNVS